ncbi:MAG: Fe-S cluster assembly protein SufD [Bacteroidaceae bacterium]|nr:Fe-S cluster assembly protein SufD [Bacteroidaceae bacterium]
MNQYIELFQNHRELIEGHSLPLQNSLRETAAKAFSRLGFPSKRVERYKYTDVPAVFAPEYGVKLDEPVKNQQIPDSVARRYGTLADVEGDAVTALNTMLSQELTVIHIPAGEHRQQPIRLTRQLHSTVPLMQNRRLLVVVEDGAEVSLLMSDQADEEQDFLTTQVTEIFVGKGASVEVYDIERTNAHCHRFHQLYADVSEGGRFLHTSFTLTCGLTRNTTNVRLSGKGANAELLGAAIIDGQQHCDNNTLIEHISPGCTSNELYKYVADEHAIGAFAGRVLVHKDAQQTESHETNSNLLCTPWARIYTQPILEIYADDVQCSHGSTVGQMNDAALFYMQQRGLGADEARLLLKQAFTAEVLQRIPFEPLRDWLRNLSNLRFQGDLNHCRTCQLCGKS